MDSWSSEMREEETQRGGPCKATSGLWGSWASTSPKPPALPPTPVTHFKDRQVFLWLTHMQNLHHLFRGSEWKWQSSWYTRLIAFSEFAHWVAGLTKVRSKFYSPRSCHGCGLRGVISSVEAVDLSSQDYQLDSSLLLQDSKVAPAPLSHRECHCLFMMGVGWST